MKPSNKRRKFVASTVEDAAQNHLARREMLDRICKASSGKFVHVRIEDDGGRVYEVVGRMNYDKDGDNTVKPERGRTYSLKGLVQFL